MKNITFFLFVILITSITFAQQKKALISVGGEIGYSYSSCLENNAYGPYENSVSQYLINPRIGYFLSKDVELGIGLGFSHKKNITEGENADSENKENIFSVNPFGRYYNYFNEDLGLFLELNLMYGFGYSEYTSSSVIENEFDITSYSIKLNPGIVYYLSDIISINASINFIEYQNTKYKVPNSPTVIPDEREVFDIGIDFKNVNLGIQINI